MISHLLDQSKHTILILLDFLVAFHDVDPGLLYGWLKVAASMSGSVLWWFWFCHSLVMGDCSSLLGNLKYCATWESLLSLMVYLICMQSSMRRSW